MEQTVYFASRNKWRRWLKTNHLRKREVWLLYYRKASGKLGISYDESVEEAICFGWIDSRVKKIDEVKFTRRFGPRLSTGIWSKFNIDRAKKMTNQRRMTAAGLAVLPPRLLKRVRT